MEDIISHGGDRPPGGHRRRALVATGLVIVLAFVVVERLPHGRHASHQGGSHLAGRHGIGQRSIGARLRVDRPAGLPPSGITGRTASWAPDARLPRTGARPVWFWPAMGRVAPIIGLPSDRFGYGFTRIDGGWAIQPDPPGSAGCRNCMPPVPAPGPASCGYCTGPPVPVYFLADRARRAVIVGSASLVAPAEVKGQMWLTTYPPDSDLPRTRGVAQRYNGAGLKVGAPVTLPAGYGITQGTRRGLLLVSLSLTDQGNTDQGNTDRLWDPATRKVLHSFDGVVAVNANAVAYAPPCTQTCPVRVFNVRSGREVTVKMRPTDTATSAVFSPDGRFLALQIGRGNGDIGDGGAAAIQLKVASAATGRALVMPHILVSSDALAAFGWPGSRDDLVAEFSFDGAVQMTSWDPAAGGNVAVADIKRAESPAALVVG